MEARRPRPRPPAAMPRPQPRRSVAEALFLPEVGVVVVAVALPEAQSVFGQELEPADPFRALPEVALRKHESERVAMLGLERLTGERVGEDDVVVIEDLERHVGRVALLGVLDDEPRRRLRTRELQDLLD